MIMKCSKIVWIISVYLCVVDYIELIVFCCLLEEEGEATADSFLPCIAPPFLPVISAIFNLIPFAVHLLFTLHFMQNTKT